MPGLGTGYLGNVCADAAIERFEGYKGASRPRPWLRTSSGSISEPPWAVVGTAGVNDARHAKFVVNAVGGEGWGHQKRPTRSAAGV